MTTPAKINAHGNLPSPLYASIPIVKARIRLKTTHLACFFTEYSPLPSQKTNPFSDFSQAYSVLQTFF